jgi:hypothetical protein
MRNSISKLTEEGEGHDVLQRERERDSDSLYSQQTPADFQNHLLHLSKSTTKRKE